MPWQFQVPTLGDQQSEQKLKNHILTSEPDANIDINSQTKTIIISSRASEETFKELIVAAGHSIATDGAV
ncbi:MAG: heavy metal transport/detoxification protein [Nodosilinea sp.]